MGSYSKTTVFFITNISLKRHILQSVKPMNIHPLFTLSLALSSIRYWKKNKKWPHTNKSQDGNSVKLSKVSCMQKIWLPLDPGKSKINLFSISFFCTHASVLPSGQWLHTALNTELSICIEATYVVLASCVIEWCIYLRAHDATMWSSRLEDSLRPVVRG